MSPLSPLSPSSSSRRPACLLLAVVAQQRTGQRPQPSTSKRYAQVINYTLDIFSSKSPARRESIIIVTELDAILNYEAQFPHHIFKAQLLLGCTMISRNYSLMLLQFAGRQF
jgi:hypothetical protein